jgi:hypothetical protein
MKRLKITDITPGYMANPGSHIQLAFFWRGET